jgi:hypothetical protein
VLLLVLSPQDQDVVTSRDLLRRCRSCFDLVFRFLEGLDYDCQLLDSVDTLLALELQNRNRQELTSGRSGARSLITVSFMLSRRGVCATAEGTIAGCMAALKACAAAV